MPPKPEAPCGPGRLAGRTAASRVFCAFDVRPSLPRPQVTPEEQRGARASLDNQAGDVALLFLPLIFGVVGYYSQRAALWTGSVMMVAANLIFSRLLKKTPGPEATAEAARTE